MALGQAGASPSTLRALRPAQAGRASRCGMAQLDRGLGWGGESRPEGEHAPGMPGCLWV